MSDKLGGSSCFCHERGSCMLVLRCGHVTACRLCWEVQQLKRCAAQSVAARRERESKLSRCNSTAPGSDIDSQATSAARCVGGGDTRFVYP